MITPKTARTTPTVASKELFISAALATVKYLGSDNEVGKLEGTVLLVELGT